MVVFQIHHTDVNAPPPLNDNEIMRYQISRYSSSNEAAWRFFGFLIHEREKAVVHLAAYLENGQREFFTNGTAIERAVNTPKLHSPNFSY